MPRKLLPLLLLFIAVPLFANLTITSVDPASGPVAGGTKVTVRGSEFASDTEVHFGDAIGINTRLIDATTIETVTPPHIPGAFNVSVGNGAHGFATLENAFTYVGAPEPAFTRILVPILVPPVHGAFGSEFRSVLVGSSFTGTKIYGLVRQCPGILCAFNPFTDPIPLPPDVTRFGYEPNGNPGRFLYIPSGTDIHLNLRVFDVSREAENFGTEVPVVRSSEFAQVIRLHGVPNDARFRSMLRIYSDSPGLIVRAKTGNVEQSIELSHGDLFSPSYAEMTLDTNDSKFPFDVTLYAPTGPIATPLPSDGATIWAFISVTNNTTQHITLITPD